MGQSVMTPFVTLTIGRRAGDGFHTWEEFIACRFADDAGLPAGQGERIGGVGRFACFDGVMLLVQAATGELVTLSSVPTSTGAGRLTWSRPGACCHGCSCRWQ